MPGDVPVQGYAAVRALRRGGLDHDPDTKGTLDAIMVRMIQGQSLKAACRALGVYHRTAKRRLERLFPTQFRNVMEMGKARAGHPSTRPPKTRKTMKSDREARDALAWSWLEAHRKEMLSRIATAGLMSDIYKDLIPLGYPGVGRTLNEWWKVQPERDAIISVKKGRGGKVNTARSKGKKIKGGNGFRMLGWGQHDDLPPIDEAKLKPLRTYQDMSETEKTKLAVQAAKVLSPVNEHRRLNRIDDLVSF